MILLEQVYLEIVLWPAYLFVGDGAALGINEKERDCVCVCMREEERKKYLLSQIPLGRQFTNIDDNQHECAIYLYYSLYIYACELAMAGSVSLSSLPFSLCVCVCHHLSHVAYTNEYISSFPSNSSE